MVGDCRRRQNLRVAVILGEVLAECVLGSSMRGAPDHNCAAQFLRRVASTESYSPDFLMCDRNNHF